MYVFYLQLCYERSLTIINNLSHVVSSSSCGSIRSGQSKKGADKKVGLRPSEQNLKDMAFQRPIFDIINQVYMFNCSVLKILFSSTLLIRTLSSLGSYLSPFLSTLGTIFKFCFIHGCHDRDELVLGW